MQRRGIIAEPRNGHAAEKVIEAKAALCDFTGRPSAPAARHPERRQPTDTNHCAQPRRPPLHPAGAGTDNKTPRKEHTTVTDRSLLAALIAVITVGFVVYYRYREASIVLPMVLTNLAEMVILLGIVRFIIQLDLATIAGLIAVLGTGIDQLIIITDEILHEGKVPSPNLYLKRLSRALGIILASAATVVVAMVPLVLMDLSTLRGFAIVTILGVLIGVLITRPAYGRIIMAILSR